MKILRAIIVAVFFVLLCNGAKAQPHIYAPEYEIFFKVGKYNLNPDYMGNAQMLGYLKDSLPQSFTRGYYIYTLKEYGVLGSASPEGKYSWNITLSRKRAEAIASYLKKHTTLNNPQFQYRGNNWQHLYMFVSEDDAVPFKEEVLEILNDIPAPLADSPQISANLLSRLKSLRGGVPYSYLLKNIFPKLRYTHFYALYYPQPRWKNVLPVEEVTTGTIIEKPAAVTSKINIEPDYTNIPKDYTERIDNIPDSSGFIFAVKTNLLYDVVTMLNYSVEIPVSAGKFSFLLYNQFPWWKMGEHRNEYCLRNISVGTEARWWVKPDQILNGYFLGIYAESGKYDFQFKRKICYQGEYSHYGISCGYAKPIGKRLNMEFALSVGYASIAYRGYTPGAGYEQLFRDPEKVGRWKYFGPTKAQVSLVLPINVKTERGGNK